MNCPYASAHEVSPALTATAPSTMSSPRGSRSRLSIVSANATRPGAMVAVSGSVSRPLPSKPPQGTRASDADAPAPGWGPGPASTAASTTAPKVMTKAPEEDAGRIMVQEGQLAPGPVGERGRREVAVPARSARSPGTGTASRHHPLQGQAQTAGKRRRQGYAWVVREWLSRCVAASVLAAILACSGLGICWLQFVPRGHSCCDQDAKASIGTASTCASLALPASVPNAVAQVALAMPTRAVTFAPVGDASHGALARVLPTRTPPLVLRI